MGLLAALFIVGAIFYLASLHDTFPGDLDALRNFQSFRSPWLDGAAVVASALARSLTVYLSIPAVSLFLWLGRRRADAAAVLLVFLPEGINLGLKELVGRPRPDFSLLASPPEGPAFPSGHALHAFLLFGLLIYLTGELIRPLWLRTTVQGILGLMVLACGASRVYLGVHWPSDVLGGFLFGGICMVALLWVRKKLVNRGLQ